MGPVMIENRHCLVVDTRTTLASGTAEREAAVAMTAARPGQHRITVGTDKAYDSHDFVADVRSLAATPHVTQNDNGRRSQTDRGGVRLDEDDRRTAQDALPRHAAGGLDVHAVGGGLQSDPATEAAGCRGVAPATRSLSKACQVT